MSDYGENLKSIIQGIKSPRPSNGAIRANRPKTQDDDTAVLKKKTLSKNFACHFEVFPKFQDISIKLVISLFD